MVAPTTSYPASTSRAAATDESTPPDMATSTRSLTTPLPARRTGGRIRRRSRTLSDRPPPHRPPPHLTAASPVEHRAQGSHLLHNLGEHRDRRVHVLGTSVVAERESQGGDAQLPRHAHRREHVRR